MKQTKKGKCPVDHSKFSKAKPINFISTVPGFAETFPVIESKELKRDWVSANAKDLANYTKEMMKSCPMEHLRNALDKGYIAKCPGIREIMNTGYIVTAPCDFIIETNGDGETFTHTDFSPKAVPYFKITGHPKDMFHNYTALPLNALKTVIKISTTWCVEPVEDYVFFIVPPQYCNESRFTCATGILDTFMDTQLNVFLYWYALNSREVVKAGTPLMQLIPVPRNFVQPSITCRTASMSDTKRQIALASIIHVTSDTNYKGTRSASVKKIYEKENY